MAKQKRRLWKVVLTDVIGILMLVLVIPVGSLPGPGGIPLLLGGLTLLAGNHELFERLLEDVKLRGGSLRDLIFPRRKALERLWDLGSLMALATSGYCYTLQGGFFIEAVATVLAAAGLWIFLLNRRRFDRIVARLRR